MTTDDRFDAMLAAVDGLAPAAAAAALLAMAAHMAQLAGMSPSEFGACVRASWAQLETSNERPPREQSHADHRPLPRAHSARRTVH